MSRWEFMRRLEELLFDISPNEREEALQYYNDYFNDAGMENEQEVIKALGSPEQVAQIVRDGLGDNNIQGEFTENGFSSGRAKAQNELIKKEAAEGASGNSDGFWANGNGRQPEDARDFGKKKETSEEKTQNFENSAASFEQSGKSNGSQPQKEKNDMPVWAIVLIVIACIIGSPVILGLACAAIGVIVGLMAAVLGVVFGIGLAALILFIVAVSLVVAGLGVIIPHPFTGIGLLGGGFLCASLGILFMLLTVLLVTKLIPAICRGIAAIYNSIFGKRKGAMA